MPHRPDATERGTRGPRRPGPILRLCHRLPLVYYRLGLGFLLGGRYIRLAHRGRSTRRLRHTVLAVVDRDESTGELFVGAVFGAGSDWYRNIVASPAVEVRAGRRSFVPRLRFVPVGEAADRIATWKDAHPRYARVVERLTGVPATAETVPMVAFGDPGRARHGGTASP